ncbi:DUF3265 domain-containing protein [Vibrio parahaemolyticus]|nr:DUF3265 domain-containing protein [Vibrio parahaemolyticus]
MRYNKAFKWDSCRVAFLVCDEFGGESGLRKVGLGGIHPLTQRYALGDDFARFIQESSSN